MSLLSTLPAIWLLGSGFLIVPPDLAGQVPASDTSAKTASDTGKTTSDTSKATSDTVQRAHPDSAAKSDSTKASPASPSATAQPSAEPGDSILTAACTGSAGVGRDLLVVVFAPDAGARDRARAAKTVTGKLLGPVSPSEPDAYYLRVPTGGNEFRLRLASDQLIRLPQVRQVGSRACPPPPPTSTKTGPASES